MKKVYHIVEVEHTKKGYPVVSVFKTFFDGEDKYGEFKTAEQKANGYLEYLEKDTKDRTFKVTESSYGI